MAMLSMDGIFVYFVFTVISLVSLLNCFRILLYLELFCTPDILFVFHFG
jgi:hypothetical protein